MVAPGDVPTRSETVVAYACAALASLVWVGCVIPGVELVDPAAHDDLATPMGRGALPLIPALLLLVSGPVTTVLARGTTTLRAMLAAGDAFVTLFMAGTLWWTNVRDPALVVLVLALLAMGFVSVRDTVLVLSDAPSPGGTSAPAGEDTTVRSRRYTDLRLALAILVVLTPASLLAVKDRERASLLAPFVYVAISALGARFSHGARGLRFTASVLLACLAAHLVVALRVVLETGMPEAALADDWTWAGFATFSLACGVLLLAVVRIGVLGVAGRSRA